MNAGLDTAGLARNEAVLIAPPAARSERLLSVDLLRGTVMVIMALDHTRDYFTYVRFQPEDVLHASLALFFTRWITHFCAPVFFFLAGTGAFLASRKKSPKELSSFLVKRGLFLVVMEQTVITFCWTFVPLFPGVIALVIWALGWSMVFLGVLVRWLPVRAIAVIGLVIVAGHNLLDSVQPAQFGRFALLWQFLHVQSFHFFTQFHGVPIIALVLYPLVPWIGVMATGYAFGALLQKPPAERRRWIFSLGAACIVLFVVLRAGHLYGNPPATPNSFGPSSNGDFHVQATLSQSVIAFLNVQKYPPSLQYLLMTLGPALLLLAYFERFTQPSLRQSLTGAIVIYGRVPMFYYVLHILLIHVMSLVVALAFQQPAKWLIRGFFVNQTPSGYGHGLPFIYLIWLLAVAILYLPCKWFSELKARRKDWWLSYI